MTTNHTLTSSGLYYLRSFRRATPYIKTEINRTLPITNMIAIPNDILYQIFLLAVDKNKISEPIKISHCCRQWRSVAVKAPPLWSYVLIHQPGKRYIDRLKAWVERSGNTNLDILIESKGSPKAFNQYLDQCLIILAPHTDRWGSLVLKAHPSSNESRQMLSTCHLPELKKLSVPFKAQPITGGWWGILEAKMPKLGELVLTGQALPGQGHVWTPAAFHQGLNKLIIRHPKRSRVSLSLTTCLGILRACPLLEDVDFDLVLHCVSSPPPILQGPPEGVVMPNLKNLRFFMENAGIYLYIHAPNLRRLDVSLPHYYIHHLLSKPTFPFPALEYVKLEAPHLHTPASRSGVTADFLSHLSALRHLTLKRAVFRKSEPQCWTFMKALKIICPNLKTLELESCRGDGMLDALQELVEGRRIHVSGGIQAISCLDLYNSACDFAEGQADWFSSNVEMFATFNDDPEDDPEDDIYGGDADEDDSHFQIEYDTLEASSEED